VVQAKINGYGPFNLLLDTGTQITIIDPKVYAQVGGTMLTNASIASMGVSRPAFYAQVASIQVGGHEDVFFKVMISALSGLQNDSSSVSTVGILGQNFLEQFSVTIDYQHSCLTLQ
jgi:predicted aspartyl protease